MGQGGNVYQYLYGYSSPINIINQSGSMTKLDRALVEWSRGSVFESHCGERSFHFVILTFFANLTAWQSDYEWNQAWHTPSQHPVLAREWYVFAELLYL